MLPQSGQKWTILDGRADEIKDLIRSYGAIEDGTLKPDAEIWRLRIDRSIFTLYKTGTLYSDQMAGGQMLELRERISALCTPGFERTGREIMIGLDETGKGEVAGDEVLCGVCFPSELYREIAKMVGATDTKSRHTSKYWDALSSRIGQLASRGLDFYIERISPQDVDKYNINRLMDEAYKGIISHLTHEGSPGRTSIVLDDYNIGDGLRSYLRGLEEAGTEVIVTNRADDRFLEAKLAAALAKAERGRIMAGINAEFQINGLSIGSGSPADERTTKWLLAWKGSGQPWPWFIKTSYSTIREIDGLSGNARKSSRPQDTNLDRWTSADAQASDLPPGR